MDMSFPQRLNANAVPNQEFGNAKLRRLDLSLLLALVSSRSTSLRSPHAAPGNIAGRSNPSKPDHALYEHMAFFGSDRTGGFAAWLHGPRGSFESDIALLLNDNKDVVNKDKNYFYHAVSSKINGETVEQ